MKSIRILIPTLQKNLLGLFSVLLFGLGASVASAEPPTRLTSSDGEVGAEFGIVVSANVDRLVVGAHLADGAAVDSGAAYVFLRQASGWIQEQRLAPTTGAAGDAFGLATALGSEVLAVGARGDDDAGADAGAVYVYRLVDGAWVDDVKLTAADAVDGAQFGHEVAWAGDDLLAVSARRDGPDDLRQGAVYLFRETAGVWELEDKLLAPDPQQDAEFGFSLAAADDPAGETLAVGEWLRDAAAGWNTGAVYVFRNGADGWQLDGEPTPGDPVAGDVFGSSVAIEGETLVVGALADNSGAFDAGAAYIFRRDGGAWVEQVELLASDIADFDAFGSAVATEDGVVAVGALAAGGCVAQPTCSHGAVYLFEEIDGVWTETDRLESPEDPEGDLLGVEITLAAGRLVAGAFGDDSEGANAGAAWSFDLAHAIFVDGFEAGNAAFWSQ